MILLAHDRAMVQTVVSTVGWTANRRAENDPYRGLGRMAGVREASSWAREPWPDNPEKALPVALDTH
jgi:hypothetical protein